jgi:hypothetical protein
MATVTTILMRFILIVPFCWVAYWVLFVFVRCLSPFSEIGSCLGIGIPGLLYLVSAGPMWVDIGNPLIMIYVPVVGVALAAAIASAWRTGEFHGRGFD